MRVDLVRRENSDHADEQGHGEVPLLLAWRRGVQVAVRFPPKRGWVRRALRLTLTRHACLARDNRRRHDAFADVAIHSTRFNELPQQLAALPECGLSRRQCGGVCATVRQS